MLRLQLLLVLLLYSGIGFAQQPYHGIVVDSVSLQNIPDVHITIKKTGKGVISNTTGSFLIYAKPTDTLIFTAVGYKPLTLPLIFMEDGIMVLLRENVLVLPDIMIKSTRLYPNKIEDYTRDKPKTMDALSGFVSPFDYFWKEERDRRKLSKLVEENNRTQVFRQVITDPDVMKIMMDSYAVNEEMYYELVTRFNQQKAHVHYFTDPDAIMEELHDFFTDNSNR